MRNFHRDKTKEQTAVALVQSNSVRLETLLSCQHTRLTTQEYAELSTRTAYRPVYAALEWLGSPSHALLPLLLKVPMRLAGRTGRPPVAYLLTDFGAQVLNLLDPELGLDAPNPRDLDDLHHRFCMMELFTRASQAGWPVQIEAVLPYQHGRQNVRADVVLETPTGRVHLEIEQELPRNNLPRAVEKFQHWQAYARESQIPVRMIFVFNLQTHKANETLANWREARNRCETELGKLKFEVAYLFTGDVLSQPLPAALEQASPLTALKVKKAKEAAPSAPEVIESLPRGMEEIYALYHAQVVAFQQAQEPREHMLAFIELMELIHAASFYKDSPTQLYAAQPRASLWLLKHYLISPNNQATYAELKEAMTYIQRRSGQMGLIMFRDAVTRLLWDVFLRQHGFSRGGALRVIFQIPDFQDVRSDYWVDVRLSGSYFKGNYRNEQIAEALGWVLSSLFIYSEELGLGQRPWRLQQKK